MTFSPITQFSVNDSVLVSFESLGKEYSGTVTEFEEDEELFEVVLATGEILEFDSIYGELSSITNYDWTEDDEKIFRNVKISKAL